MSSRLQPSDFGLPSDAKRPVMSALGHAYAENMSALAAAVEEAYASAPRPEPKTDEAEAMRLLEDLIRFGENAVELSHWIYPPKVLSIRDATSRAEVFRELGEDWVNKMRSGAQKFREGKPARMRQSHIEALEFMLESKRNSLGRAVQKFCSCGKRHDAKCT